MGVVGVPKSRLKQFGFRVKRELFTYKKEPDACGVARACSRPQGLPPGRGLGAAARYEPWRGGRAATLTPPGDQKPACGRGMRVGVPLPIQPPMLSATSGICLRFRSPSHRRKETLGRRSSRSPARREPAGTWPPRAPSRAALRNDADLSGILGPDFKLFASLEVNSREAKVEWRRLILSIQHVPKLPCERRHRILLPSLEQTLKELEARRLEGVASTFASEKLILNGPGNSLALIGEIELRLLSVFGRCPRRFRRQSRLKWGTIRTGSPAR